jgi:hypothetical protein
MKTTITEALADIKTSQARIVKKRAAVNVYLGRDSRIRDPLEGEGGSPEFIRRELQGIMDLEKKIVTIRSAIQKANLETTLEIEGTSRTLSAWLNWRREIADAHKGFLAQMAQQIDNLRKQAVSRGQPVVAAAVASVNTDASVGELIVNVSEKDLREEIEQMENVLGQLDGKLSLLNATTTIEI